MPSNIEIKARVKDYKKLVDLAEKLSSSPKKIILQHDIFFNIPKGRLKLRIFDDQNGELIFYHRSDQKGPKQSNYSIAKTNEPLQLKSTLEKALTLKGEVIKKRTLFLVGQTRVHVDEVENLGHYMELEVVLKEGQTAEEGTLIAHDLMKRLNISEIDLIDKAYIDLLLNHD